MTYSFRNLKAVDWTLFAEDVQRSSLFSSPATTADEFADQLDTTVTSILDRFCPIQFRRKFASCRRDSRWLSTGAVDAKRNRRRLERKWKSSRSVHDYVSYRRACRSANKSIVDSRKQFYKERISAACANPRGRWTPIRDVLHLTNTSDIQSTSKCQALCEKFAVNFVDKIRKIKTAIESKLVNP